MWRTLFQFDCRVESRDTKVSAQCFLLSVPCHSRSRKRFALASSFVAGFEFLQLIGYNAPRKTGRVVLASLPCPPTRTVRCVLCLYDM